MQFSDQLFIGGPVALMGGEPMPSLTLPDINGVVSDYVLGSPSAFPSAGPPIRVRAVYAAAHVVMDPRTIR